MNPADVTAARRRHSDATQHRRATPVPDAERTTNPSEPMTEEQNAQEFLVEVAKRAPLLEALDERPCTMQELDDDLSMSRSTIHRALQTLEDHHVIENRDSRYALTGFGQYITDETATYRTKLATSRDLDDFLDVVDEADIDVPLEAFADAEVTRPQPHQAHLGLKRIIDLIERSASLRMFSSIISPMYVDVTHREILDGMEIEVIFDARIVDIVRSEYAEKAVEALETGRFTVHVGTDIPFELFIYDDKLSMAVHDESALPRLFLETDAPAAIEWAEDLYRSYQADAWQFSPDQLDQLRRTEGNLS